LQPVSRWGQLFQKISSSASLLNTDSLTRQQVLDEITERFGQADAHTLRQLTLEPKVRVGTILSQVLNKPS